MKLTKWYPGEVKPVRIGFYERKRGSTYLEPAKWTGKRWVFASWHVCGIQNCEWRGLAEKQS